jgi:hypothetical protein
MDARGLEGLNLEQHAKQEDMRTQYQRRVVDDFGDFKFIASGLISTMHVTEQDG